MPYIALEQYNARGPQAPRALCHPVQYMACCTRAPAITNLLPNDVNPFPALDDICRPADRDFSKICCAGCVGDMHTL